MHEFLLCRCFLVFTLSSFSQSIIKLDNQDYKIGWGGKFGLQEDRKDASAAGWDYQSKLSQHESQKGNGHAKLPTRSSLLLLHNYYQDSAIVRGCRPANSHFLFSALADHSKGFGGKYGVQDDRVDKSAVGWDHKEEVSKHESQKGSLLSGNCVDA